MARHFPTAHYALNLRDAAREIWKEDTLLDTGGNRSARRKPARASMDREPNSHTTLTKVKSHYDFVLVKLNKLSQGQRYLVRSGGCWMKHPKLLLKKVAERSNKRQNGGDVGISAHETSTFEYALLFVE